MNTIALTKRQQEVLDYVSERRVDWGRMPSTREIQRHFGFASQTAVVKHLKALERKGRLRRMPGDLLPMGGGAYGRVPLLGSIPAGFATAEQEHVEGSLAVDLETLGVSSRARTFALRVRGDSMIDAHILEGDLVVMEYKEPRDGDVVAALIDGETTLKRFVMNQGKPYLKAENSAYPDLLPIRELVIQGVLVALVRRGF